MTIMISVDDASLPELLAKVEAGEEVILMRDDVPVAKIAPVVASEDKRRQAMEAILAFRKKMPGITQEEIAEWKAIGRR